MAIRELTAPALRHAAEDNEVIGITNDRVLAGILFPIGRDWVEQLVEQNLSRIVRNVQRGEQEVTAGLAAGDQAEEVTDSAVPVAPRQFTTLEDVARHPSAPLGAAVSNSRRVHLRDMSGKLLRAAAERNEAIVLTTDKVVAGIIFPVTQQWVTELVEQNLSRVLYNVGIGEKELTARASRVTLDDLVKDESPDEVSKRSSKATASGDIHTSKQGDRWVNKAEGNQRVSNSASTKAEAQAAGRQMAIDRGVEHIVHREDGQIGQRNAYPRTSDSRQFKG